MNTRGDKLYLKLLHGRKSVDETVEGWGSEGPKFGPLANVRATYLFRFRMTFESGTCIELPVVEDLILWKGVYYGDFALFTERW